MNQEQDDGFASLDSSKEGTGGSSTTTPSPGNIITTSNTSRSISRRVSKDDEFVSASDLSSVLDNLSSIASSTSNDNSSEISPLQIKNVSTSTSTTPLKSKANSVSTSAINIISISSESSSIRTELFENSETFSSSSSRVPEEISKKSLNTNLTEKEKMGQDLQEDNPIFATCSSTATSGGGTAGGGSFRRSESWSGIQNVDNSQNDSETDLNEDDSCSRKSSMSINEKNQNEYHQPSELMETYHTPSTSLHNIVHSKQLSLDLNLKKSKAGGAGVPIPALLENENQLILIDDISTELDKSTKELDNISEESANAKIDEASTSKKENEDKLPLLKAFSPSSSVEEDDKSEDIKDGLLTLEDIQLDSISVDSIPMPFSGELTLSPELLAVVTARGIITPVSLKDVQQKGSKTVKSRSKPTTKKKMWYQIFSASYKSRSGDFKKLFKELPAKERLLVDYSCALQKEILLQGRMYISQGYLSFHANIFGWETQISIRLKEITSITKEKTALVIPNAIQVNTDSGDKLFFTSFVTRDATFLMLFKLWQSALLEDALPSKEIQRLIHCSYGEELVITSDDDTAEEIRNSKSTLMHDVTDGATLISVCNFQQDESIVIDSQGATDIIAPPASIAGSPGVLSSSNALVVGDNDELVGQSTLPVPTGIQIPSDVTDSSDSEDDFQAAQGVIMEEPEIFDIPQCPVLHTEGRETINAIIPCNIDQLFTMLFTSSKFYLDFHTTRKTFNINQSQWEIGKDAKKTRQVSMTVSLSAVMGPKHSQVTETQVMQTESKPGLFYAIDSESVNAGVPYADTFYVTIHYCLSRISATESKLIVVNQVKYKKSVWGITKSIIEKNCWAGIEEFYAHLERALKEESAKMMLGASPVPSPKKTASNLPRRRPPRNNKRRAPDVPVLAVSQIPRGSLRGSITGETLIPQTIVVNENSIAPSNGSSWFLKAIVTVLICLLMLNAFLYFKLTRLETTATTSIFSSQSFDFSSGEIPQNHQEWLVLLQKQEALHRTELQKWHEILMSALQILHQAESDLEALKFHISSYNGGKYSVNVKDSAVFAKSNLPLNAAVESEPDGISTGLERLEANFKSKSGVSSSSSIAEAEDFPTDTQEIKNNLHLQHQHDEI